MSGIRVSEKHGVNPMLVVCMFCGEDSGEIALLGRLPNDAEAPRRGVMHYEPCPKCKENMAKGITLMESVDGKKPTGRWCVITEECAQRMFVPGPVKDAVLKMRKTFVDPQTWAMLHIEEAANGNR